MSDLRMQEKVNEREIAVAFMAQLDEEHAMRMREDKDYELRMKSMLDPAQFERQSKALDAYCRERCLMHGVAWPIKIDKH